MSRTIHMKQPFITQTIPLSEIMRFSIATPCRISKQNQLLELELGFAMLESVGCQYFLGLYGFLWEYIRLY